MDSQVLPRQEAVRERSRSNDRPVLWYAAAGLVLFCGYLRLSSTYVENSDMANILLMGWDLLHGNLLLYGWHMSDVSLLSNRAGAVRPARIGAWPAYDALGGHVVSPLPVHFRTLAEL